MRIGVDALAIQSPYSRGRGIGRYARSLLAAMLERDDEHEYLLYTYEDLPREALPTSSKVRIREVRRRFDRGEHTLQHAVERTLLDDSDRLDWFLLLSPFETWEFYGLPHRPVRGPRSAAVLYDLIPFLFQETYLDTEEVGRWFYGHLRRLARYDLLLAISEATRLDAIRLLDLPPGRVHAIGSASEPPPPIPDDPARDRAILDRLGIDRPFLFCLGSGDPRKNLRGLIDAFSLLPERHRAGTQLVVTCSLIEKEIRDLREHAASAGVDEQLLLTNAVDQNALTVLYRCCSAFVFPSLYEGFGLPILEAMQLGAPVVASNNSSQPEVVGDAGLLANASEPADLAARIAQLLDDPDLRRRLGERGRRRSEQFDWADVAARTLGALEAAGPPRPMRHALRVRVGPDAPDRPRIAVFSPLPPTPSGIARYADRVVRSLREDALVDLYHPPGDRPESADASPLCASFDAAMFERRSTLIGYDAVLYQFGNSSYHTYLYETFLRHPGIVTLHDLALPGFHASYGLIAGKMNAHLVEEILYSGQAADPEAVAMAAGWVPGTWDIQEEMVRRGVTMNRRILERATAVIVHSKGARDRIASAYPWLSAKIHAAAIGCDPAPVTPDRRAAARRALGIDPGAVVFGSVGILHPTKLNLETIRAFANSASDLPGCMLVFLGRDLGNGEARREADRLGISDRVRFLGHLDDDEYERTIDAFDIGLGLRRPPTNGESSAALLDLLRRGLPTVVCDAGTFSEYPDHVVSKISWTSDQGGTAQLGAALRVLALDEDRRHRMGRSALEHVSREHSWPQLIDLYRRLCFSERPRAPHATIDRKGVA